MTKKMKDFQHSTPFLDYLLERQVEILRGAHSTPLLDDREAEVYASNQAKVYDKNGDPFVYSRAKTHAKRGMINP